MHGAHVFRSQDLRVLFREDSDWAFNGTIRRMVKSGFLMRASKGVFFNPFSKHRDGQILERIAGTIRRGEFCYLSMETVLSWHSIISQQILNGITVMTTGKSGRYMIRGIGEIEFIHTSRKIGDIVSNVLWETYFLPQATAEQAWRDLRNVGRNLHLVSKPDLEEVIDEQRQAELS